MRFPQPEHPAAKDRLQTLLSARHIPHHLMPPVIRDTIKRSYVKRFIGGKTALLDLFHAYVDLPFDSGIRPSPLLMLGMISEQRNQAFRLNAHPPHFATPFALHMYMHTYNFFLSLRIDSHRQWGTSAFLQCFGDGYKNMGC